MMEIPAWELCKGCCFLAYCDNIDPFCNYPLQRRDGSDDDWDGCNQPEDVVFRGASCLAAYPNGAVIEIKPK